MPAEDCLVVGSGVIGLSLAWELALAGQRVRVIDRAPPIPGADALLDKPTVAPARVIDRAPPVRGASWAGAGIFPPGKFRPQASPLAQLVGLSNELHPLWAMRLLVATGIDNCFRQTGNLTLALDDRVAELRQQFQDYQAEGVAAHWLDAAAAKAAEPAIHDTALPIGAGILLPEETQLRNPRHLQALMVACVQQGVQFSLQHEVHDFSVRGDRVTAVRTSQRDFTGDAVCLCAGAWVSNLTGRLGFQLPVRPIRGQMVLLNSDARALRHIIYVGLRYLVPRHDGRVLIGSTLEDVGFACHPTPSGVADLLDFAIGLAPRLAQAQFEESWAGLRPASADGLPYLGRAPGWQNAFVASGHYRAGLHLSPVTAVLLRQLILGQATTVDLVPFRPDR